MYDKLLKPQLHKILSVLLNEGYLMNLYDSSDYHYLYLDKEHKIEAFVDECFYIRKCTIQINTHDYIELDSKDGGVVIIDVNDANIEKMISEYY